MTSVLVGIMVIVSFCAVGFAFFSPELSNREKTAKRIKAIGQVGANPIGGKDQGQSKGKDRRKAVQDKLKELEEKQKVAQKKLTIKDRITQAGLELPMSTFYIGSAVLGVVCGLLALFSGQSLLICAAVVFVSGFGLPRWIVGFLASRRQKAFIGEFANAVDVIVRGIKAGLPLNECLQIIANESPDPVGMEFRDLVESQKVGVPLEQGMQRLYERMPLAEVNFFTIVLAIQAKTGGNLSEALGNLSKVLRARKMMQAKIKSMSQEAKSSASIIGALPPVVMLFVYLSTPEYISLLFTETLGNVMLVGGAMWMATGVFIMKKMISFKF